MAKPQLPAEPRCSLLEGKGEVFHSVQGVKFPNEACIQFAFVLVSVIDIQLSQGLRRGESESGFSGREPGDESICDSGRGLKIKLTQ